MPLSSDQAIAVVSELLVPAYVNEHPLTKGVIASIPADKVLSRYFAQESRLIDAAEVTHQIDCSHVKNVQR